MIDSPVDISKEIATMWEAYHRISTIFETHNNPETEINCAIIDVIVKTKIGSPGDAKSISAFGNHLKFMVGSKKNGILQSPTESVFNDWYYCK